LCLFIIIHKKQSIIIIKVLEREVLSPKSFAESRWKKNKIEIIIKVGLLGVFKKRRLIIWKFWL